jgi:hypothetical protein
VERPPELPPAFEEVEQVPEEPVEEKKPETASERYLGGLLAARRRARSKTDRNRDD